MNKYLCLLFLSCFAFGAGLYHPHILRTIRGEMGFAETPDPGLTFDSLDPGEKKLIPDLESIKVPGQKSTVVAYSLYVCVSVLPCMLFIPLGWGYAAVYGGPFLIIGPNVGLIYAGDWRHGCISTIIRPTMALLAIGGFSLYSQDNEISKNLSYLSFAVSAGVTIYSYVSDGIAMKKAIDKYNRKLRLKFYHKFEQEEEKVGLGLSFSF